MPYTYNPFIEGLDYYKNPSVLSGTISDHGQLTGLSDDDHLQYHSDVRGDVRYYTKTSLNAGQLDNRYYMESEVDTISGSLQANIDDKDNYESWSFAVDGITKDAIISSDVLNFVGGDNITVTRSADDEITISGGAVGVTDHAVLSNLDYASASHTGFQPAGNYATDAELTTVSGDLQTNIDGKSDTGHTHTEANITDLDKYTQAEVNTISGALSTEIDSDISIHSSSSDHDGRYYTESEVDALTWTESDITDLDKYTQAEVDTISGSLNNKIDIYKTIYIDAAAMVPCTTFGALQGTNEYSTNDIDMDYFAFDSGSTEERVQFKLKLPENWNLGTIKVKFDWSSATGSTAGDTVEWAIKAGALSDSAIDAALGTPQVISDALLADNGTDLQTTSATPALTVGGTPTKNDLLIFEVYRNTDGTDDCAEDAWLFSLTIQYKKSGSTTAW